MDRGILKKHRRQKAGEMNRKDDNLKPPVVAGGFMIIKPGLR